MLVEVAPAGLFWWVCVSFFVAILLNMIVALGIAMSR